MIELKVLMVCLGNICRSPLAEGIFSEKAKQSSIQFHVDSAGTGNWHSGESPDPRSIAVAKKHGIDISHQRARQIKPNDFSTFDFIFTMDQSVHNDVVRLMGDKKEKDKVFLLLTYAGLSPSIEVADPYWGGEPEFESTYQLLNTACEAVVARFSKT